MKQLIKQVCNLLAIISVTPLTLLCWLERRLAARTTLAYDTAAHAVALIPGRAGVYARRAFYSATLESCSMDCTISFGAFFSRRTARVESGVYVGAYAIIGAAWLEQGCLIGSRASLPSGGQLHHREQGKWGPTDFSQETRIRIGPGAWLGEGVIVMADIGAGALVAAGSVVSTAVKPNVVVAGNPARFVRTLEPCEPNDQEYDEQLPAPTLLPEGRPR